MNSTDRTIIERLQNITDISGEIWIACQQTFIMVSIAVVIGIIFGLLLGISLYVTREHGVYENKGFYRISGFIVDIFRAFPFVILMLVLGPIAKIIVGKSIGPFAASVSLSVAAIFYFSRLVEQNLREIDKGIIEAALAMGTNPIVIVFKVMVNEARAGIVSSITILLINVLASSAAAGMIGGGGLGDLAIRYGHYRYQTEVMLVIVLILVAIVVTIQSTGNYISKRLDKR